MSHAHGPHCLSSHAPHSGSSASEKRLWWVAGISLLTMIAEVSGGVIYGSLALLADGWHMAIHAGVLGIACGAMVVARRERHTGKFAFGTGKIRALGGFANALILWAAGAGLGLEALERLFDPHAIHAHESLAIAVVGLGSNLLCVWLLKGCPECHGHAVIEGHRHATDHNLRAAYLHLLTDAATSLTAIVGVMGAGWGYLWLDPAMAAVTAALIFWWAWGLLRQVVPMLLDRTAEDVRARAVEEVENAGGRVLEMRVWAVAPGSYALLARLASPQGKGAAAFQEALKGRLPLNLVFIEMVDANAGEA